MNRPTLRLPTLPYNWWLAIEKARAWETLRIASAARIVGRSKIDSGLLP